jgi:hypothetical protein
VAGFREVKSSLTASVERLHGLGETCPDGRSASIDYPFVALQLANRMASEATLLLGLARELEAEVHEELGRFAARVVDRAARLGDAETAAVVVAEAFLSLCPERRHSE